MTRPRSRDHAFLRAHGLDVSPSQLEQMVEHAIRELRETLLLGEPDTELPESELAELRRGGFDVKPRKHRGKDPLTSSVAEYAAILETSLSTREAARRLGVGEARVRQRLTSEPPTLIGFKVGGSWRLPALQFTSRGGVPGIEDVAAALDSALHPVAIQRWFTRPCPDLETEDGEVLSPREWLCSGRDVETVVALAVDL